MAQTNRPDMPTTPVKPSGFVTRPSPEEELVVLKRVIEHLKANPEEARNLLVEAGIYTAKGKLRKEYGG